MTSRSIPSASSTAALIEKHFRAHKKRTAAVLSGSKRETWFSAETFVALCRADEITVSAPRGRVDLGALKQPRLGGKEPSDDDYRVRFAHALSTDCDVGYGYGRAGGAATGTRKRRSASFLLCAARAGASGDRSHWVHALVRGPVGRVGARVVDGRCGEDTGVGSAQAKDGRPGRGTLAESVAPGPLSADLAAIAGGAGFAAIGLAPAEAGVDAWSSEESTAGAGDGRRSMPQEEAVHGERTQGTGRPGARAVGELSTAGVAADVR